ncbi:MAG: pilus assembly protein [Acidobacteria bacterium]|nr:pilus assembly protein [Acidobacteriota bacterium]
MNQSLYSRYISSGRIIGPFRRRSIGLSERGQSMVEFALILPLFLVFIFAVLEIGRAWSAKQSLTIAAREGARILVMPYGLGPAYKYKSEEEVIKAAQDAVRDSMNGSGTPVVVDSTRIEPARIRPGIDGVFNTEDDVKELYLTSLSPPVVRGDRVGFFIKYKFETPAPVLLRMFDNGGETATQSEINMSVICFMDHE